MNKRVVIGVVAFLGVFLVLAVAWSTRTPSLQSYAVALVALCNEKGEVDKTECYQVEGSKLYGTLPLSEIFEVIRRVRSLDPEYQFCHLWGHRLGELRVLEDPSRWVEAVPENPTDGMCSNGFIHGVIIGRFRDDVVSEEDFAKELPNFKRACAPHDAWQPSDLDRAMCYHGMGHLFTFITEANMRRAVSMCTRVATGEAEQFLRVCTEGIFMQIYQAVEPDDFELLTHLKNPPTKETYRTFCKKYPEPEVQGACMREAFALFREDLKQGKGAVQFCAGHPATEMRACYETVLSAIGRTNLAEPEVARAACERLGTTWSGECAGRVALAYMEEDRNAQGQAISFCLSSGVMKKDCLLFIFSRSYYLYPREEDRDRMCAVLSDLSGEGCISLYTVRAF